jgi:hypothetical protein
MCINCIFIHACLAAHFQQQQLQLQPNLPTSFSKSDFQNRSNRYWLKKQNNKTGPDQPVCCAITTNCLSQAKKGKLVKKREQFSFFQLVFRPNHRTTIALKWKNEYNHINFLYISLTTLLIHLRNKSVVVVVYISFTRRPSVVHATGAKSQSLTDIIDIYLIHTIIYTLLHPLTRICYNHLSNDLGYNGWR